MCIIYLYDIRPKIDIYVFLDKYVVSRYFTASFIMS